MSLMQDDAGKRLLVIAQRRVERLEGVSESLHLLGTLGHTLAGAVEAIGKCGALGTLLPASARVRHAPAALPWPRYAFAPQRAPTASAAHR
jgi:hypothetical protein